MKESNLDKIVYFFINYVDINYYSYTTQYSLFNIQIETLEFLKEITAA